MTETKENALSDRNITILYGSQTGNAIDVSERISVELKRRLFNTSMMSMDDYSIESLPKEKIIVFVASTTGQGDTPDNMKVCTFIYHQIQLTKKLTKLKSQ